MLLSSRRTLLPILGTTLGVAAVSGLIALIRLLLPIPNLSVLYLLVVMFCAVTWGWWTAIGAAVLGFLAYDFLFVEPQYTFTIRDPQEWIALLIFLAVAGVTSNLAARERARRDEARRQARTATLLYEVSRSLDSDVLEPALRAVAGRLIAQFGLDGVAISLEGGPNHPRTQIVVGDAGPALGPRPAGRVFAAAGSGPQTGRLVKIVTEATHQQLQGRPRRPVVNFPLRRDRTQWGMLQLVGRPEGFAQDETDALAAIADRVALALERESLREEANQAEVLRRTDELRTALLSSVSHDLRTPLAAIKASAESLLQTDVRWSDADRAGFAAAINREADRLNRLVGNLLDMSRIEGGSLRLQRDWYDVGELLREVVDRLKYVLDGREVQLEIEDGLPPALLDYLLLDQVVTNLVENAAKYTPTDAPIQVSATRADGTIRVAVADHGPGIPADKRERIFDKFFRLESKPGVRGSGLGLAVSRGLVEAHGGRIWAEDNPGGGARFVFEIPVTPPGDRPAPDQAAPALPQEVR